MKLQKGMRLNLRSLAVGLILVISCLHPITTRSADPVTLESVMFKEVDTGIYNEQYQRLTMNGDLYFTFSYYPDDSWDGFSQIWKSDGTTEGTVMIKDTYEDKGANSNIYIDLYKTVGNNLFFGINYWDPDYYYELWKTDGTAAGTVKIKTFQDSPGTVHTVDLDGVLLFYARDDIHGNELWRSDGTADGTYMVKDIYPGSNNCGISWDFVILDNVAYFNANDGVHGGELWRSDGTADGTYMVKDIYPGNVASHTPMPTISLDGILFFSADDSIYGKELWRSDGTEEGTYMVKDILSGATGSYPLNGYSATHVYNGELYFAAANKAPGDSDRRFELWKTDGTEAGTEIVKPGINISETMIEFNGELYFAAADEMDGFYWSQELWKTNGTEAGTIRVADINPGTGRSSPSGLLISGDYLYFTANDGTSGRKVWRTDGAESGTQAVGGDDVYTDRDPNLLVNINNSIIFSVIENTDDSWIQLWALKTENSDENDEGEEDPEKTEEVADIPISSRNETDVPTMTELPKTGR